MLSEPFSKGGTAFATRSFPGTDIRRLSMGQAAGFPTPFEATCPRCGLMAGPSSMRRRIRAKASRRIVSAPCGAPSNHRGRFVVVVDNLPVFIGFHFLGCPWKLPPNLRVSPLALRSFFDNSIFRLSTSDRTFASLRPVAMIHNFIRGRVS